MTRENKDIESEYHKKYADIHIVLEGEEIIGYTSFEDCVETKAYNSEKDIAFVKGENQAEVLLNGKNFALFFPEEVHLPLLKVGEIKEIKKVVFKIEI
jgi:YhcH/YjgK/YiaL family protein